MDRIVSEFYQENLQIKASSGINFQFDTKNYFIYEVIRTTNGVLLFLEDHLNRMKTGLSGFDLKKNYCESDIRNILLQLLLANRNRIGNIKLLCKIFKKELFYAAYYIAHEYPSEQMYRKGIKLTTYIIERPDPNIKQVVISERIRKTIDNTKIQTSAYEILLVDHNGCITEGSKSNIFFVRDKKLYSPPEDKILKGITRKHVLQIARKNKIGVNFIQIKLLDVNQYDSAFICGTSPKVMPVKSIDSNYLVVNNKITDLILREYDNDIQSYIKNLKYE